MGPLSQNSKIYVYYTFADGTKPPPSQTAPAVGMACLNYTPATPFPDDVCVFEWSPLRFESRFCKTHEPIVSTLKLDDGSINGIKNRPTTSISCRQLTAATVATSANGRLVP